MNYFTLNGRKIFYKDLQSSPTDSNKDDFQHAVVDFIVEWKSGEAQFHVGTSGSTGPPKKLSFTREQMTRSAERTLAFFGLKPGDSALLCLNPSFIAGKMMLVRALVGDLNLVCITPTSNPFESQMTNQKVDLAAVTPMQMETALNESPEKIAQFKHILIGGAGIHPELERRLRRVNASKLYHSFSMTETLTHIAIRKINHGDAPDVYTLLEGISITTDDRSCLVIKDEQINLEKIITNDIVEIVDDSSFRWLGRYDLVVNSGGIKIQIEEVEQKIREVFHSQGFNPTCCILAAPDPRLTEMLVLLIEGEAGDPERHNIQDLLKKKLRRYHVPKEIVLVPKLFLTRSGKIDRIKNAEVYINRDVK